MTSALVIALLLIFLRVAAFVAFLPPFSGRNIPSTVKIGLAVCLTVLWGSRLAPATAMELSTQPVDNLWLIAWLAARETMFGAALGWFLGLILIPARVAGAYVVQEMGLTMATITSPTESSESNIVSQFIEIAAVLLILGTNIHHRFLRLFDATFVAFPLGRPWNLPERGWVIGSMTHSVDLGLAVAAPVGVLLFVALIATLCIMRQTPQFNLFTFGMPLRLLVGLAGLLWFLPQIVTGLFHSLQMFSSFSGV